MGICINPDKDKLWPSREKGVRTIQLAIRELGELIKGWYHMEDFMSIFVAIRLDIQQQDSVEVTQNAYWWAQAWPPSWPMWPPHSRAHCESTGMTEGAAG